MAEPSWREEIVPMIRTLQIIIAALLAGLVLFLAVAGVVVRGGDGAVDPASRSMLQLVLILFLIGDVTARIIVPGLIVKQARRKIAAGQWVASARPDAAGFDAVIEKTGDAGRLMVVYQQRTIVAAALLEGLAFFSIVVFLTAHSMLGLAIAIGMIVAVAMHFPTRSSVTHWIETQLDLVEGERGQGAG